jgi:hypothetical protein
MAMDAPLRIGDALILVDPQMESACDSLLSSTSIGGKVVGRR